ncbi:hypothetical protein IFM89_016877 [Coptis chinensis]|uniref:Uncharacterized protein n=1 Tax=Coptis chinensis TaxID=261450 RepID=A0A835I2V4_9MAGN|nr:hypothetical protein IFM89_016877 [Coptis chinensis]
MGSMKRIVFMTWERRLTGEGNVVSLGRVQQKKAINWWDGLAAVQRLLWRFKSQWRQFETDAEDSGHSSGNPTPRRGIPPPTAPLPAEDMAGETRPLTEAEPPLSSRHFHPLLDAEMWQFGCLVECKTFSGTMSFSSV